MSRLGPASKPSVPGPRDGCEMPARCLRDACESAAPARGRVAAALTKRGDPADAAVDAALLQQVRGTGREAGCRRSLGTQLDPAVAVRRLVRHLVEALRTVAAPWPKQRRPYDPSRVPVRNPCFHRPITPAAASMTYVPNATSARCRSQENGEIGLPAAWSAQTKRCPAERRGWSRRGTSDERAVSGQPLLPPASSVPRPPNSVRVGSPGSRRA